jgi:hypothetical protein
MLGTALRYFLSYPIRSFRAVARDPLEAWTTFQDRYVYLLEQRRPRCQYAPEYGWEPRLHSLIGVPWPCEATLEFHALWPQVTRQLQATGIRVGPESFGAWNDGDAAFMRVIWCLIRHLKPGNVIETGVAHGFSSRFILEALEKNGPGHLWSIDLPPLDPALQSQVGVAVGDRFPDRWSFIKGSSRRCLPGLISQLCQIDLFIHDSIHSERNVRFESNLAWKALKPGGALVIDDIDANSGFQSLTQTFADHQSMICEAEPVRPDTRRFNKRGLFGIILKEPLAKCRS